MGTNVHLFGFRDLKVCFDHSLDYFEDKSVNSVKKIIVNRRIFCRSDFSITFQWREIFQFCDMQNRRSYGRFFILDESDQSFHSNLEMSGETPTLLSQLKRLARLT